MSDLAPTERHIETVATLDVAVSAALSGFAAWLFAGLQTSAPHPEAVMRMALGSALAAGAVFFFALWMAIERRLRTGRRAQLATAIVLLPVVPVGSLLGSYVLWTLTRHDSRSAFETPRTPIAARTASSRPYWSIVLATLIVGVTTFTWSAVRARELWLEQQVSNLADSVDARQESLSRRLEQLHANGALDLTPTQVVPSRE